MDSVSKFETALKKLAVPEEHHLIISLGGCGADMLREVKGMIRQNCCADKDESGAPDKVACIAFDIAPNEKDKASGKATGSVKLSDDELTILSAAMLDSLLDPSTREFNKAAYPWLYKWLDTDIPRYPGMGLCRRQEGRLILFMEINKVVEKIRKAIVKLITGAGAGSSLNIYILSGVCGGTGGGTFLDMAYIVREIAKETYDKHIRISGYLLMPDVNLLNADTLSRPVLLRNAGAALQELDQAMKLPETGDHYECRYAKDLKIKTDKRPFDYVYLISAKAKGADLPKDPYQHCLDTVAGSICCFALKQKAAVSDELSRTTFPMDSFYSNIAAMQSRAAEESSFKERPACYLSIGYDSREIPQKPEEIIGEELLPSLDMNAKPLFDGERDSTIARLIMIPAGFDQIERTVKSYCSEKPGTFILKSDRCNRISVINILTGISMHEYTLYGECETQIADSPVERGLYLCQGDESFAGAVNYMHQPLPPVIPARKRVVSGPAPERIARYEKSLIDEFRQMRKREYPFLQFVKQVNRKDYDLYIKLSAGLDESGFYEMTAKENYSNKKEGINTEKLRDLIAKLKEIRFQTGLPGKNYAPGRLTVCERILSTGNSERKERYSGLSAAEAQKEREEAAWETAEWFYLSSYNLYMKAKEEKAKYDTIEEKIKELQITLDKIESRPSLLAGMAKMLASKVVLYDPKFCRYVYEDSGEYVELVKIEPGCQRVREIKLFEKLWTLRTGSADEQVLFEQLGDRAYDQFDAVMMKAYEKAYDEMSESGKYPEDSQGIRTVIDLYERLAAVRQEAAKCMASIVKNLTSPDNRPLLTDDPTTLDFYSEYYEAVDNEIRTGGQVAVIAEILRIVDQKGDLLPEALIFEKPEEETVTEEKYEEEKYEEEKPEEGKNEEQKADAEPVNRDQFSTYTDAGDYSENKTTNPAAVYILPQKDLTQPGFWKCPICGHNGNTGNFCPVCASRGFLMAYGPGYWTCPVCGKENNNGNFCTRCGASKPYGI